MCKTVHTAWPLRYRKVLEKIKNGGELPGSTGGTGPAKGVVKGVGVVVVVITGVVPSIISTNTQTAQSDNTA